MGFIPLKLKTSISSLNTRVPRTCGAIFETLSQGKPGAGRELRSRKGIQYPADRQCGDEQLFNGTRENVLSHWRPHFVTLMGSEAQRDFGTIQIPPNDSAYSDIIKLH